MTFEVLNFRSKDTSKQPTVKYGQDNSKKHAVVYLQPTERLSSSEGSGCGCRPGNSIENEHVRIKNTHWMEGRRRASRIRAARRRRENVRPGGRLRTVVASDISSSRRLSTNTRFQVIDNARGRRSVSRRWLVIHYDKRRWDKWKLDG